MRWAKIAAWFVVILQTVNMMQILLHDSLYHGVGNDFFNEMFKDYWGAFISFDLMTGLILFSTWLAWREKGARLVEKVAWIWSILWWGNIVVALYILVAIHEARGNVSAFFAGSRSGEELRSLMMIRTPASRVVSLIVAGGTALWLWHALDLVDFKGVPAFGLWAGFPPLVMAFLLMAFPRQLQGLKD